jgi:hypothetical protein
MIYFSRLSAWADKTLPTLPEYDHIIPFSRGEQRYQKSLVAL